VSAECAEVANQPHSEMHQKILKFTTFKCYSVCKLKTTQATTLVDSCSDMFITYSYSEYFVHSTMRCCITVHHFTTLLLLNVCDLIARYNIPMTIKGSCLKLIASVSSIGKVKRMTSIKPSKDELFLFLYYTTAGLHRIRSSNFSSPSNVSSPHQMGKHYRPFPSGVK
jgi:hypothetical protein